MEAFQNSFLLVFFSEMGDKTQLLALILGAKFRKPIPILFGILVATILNHALASFAGSFAIQCISPLLLRWSLGAIFIIFGLWLLIPDKAEGIKIREQWGPFLTTTLAFFSAEMGDKTQLATVALSANYGMPVIVTLGTTIAMMLADGLAVFFGCKFTDRLPMKFINKIACLIFVLFGSAILVGL